MGKETKYHNFSWFSASTSRKTKTDQYMGGLVTPTGLNTRKWFALSNIYFTKLGASHINCR